MNKINKIKTGEGPPPTSARVAQGVIRDLTDKALGDKGEWYSLDLERMNTGNSMKTASANIGRAMADIMTRDGVLYVRVNK